MNATWSTTKTGMTYHSFGVAHAECRKNIKADQYRELRTEAEVDGALAAPWGIRTQGYRKCTKCAQLEADFRDRQEASMSPSTGEGDYLPPVAPVPAENVTTTDPNEEEPMSPSGRRMTGPLTPVQHAVIDGMIAGKQQQEVAAEVGVSPQYVSGELNIVRRKLGCSTVSHAVATVATWRAYRAVAAHLEEVLLRDPIDEVEVRVNYVLSELATLYRTRAARLMPE